MFGVGATDKSSLGLIGATIRDSVGVRVKARVTDRLGKFITSLCWRWNRS